jgi:hypothetical protein
MLRSIGYQIEELDWEEALLYAMASNGDYFDSGMTKFSEKLLDSKILKVIEISQSQN